MAVASVARRMVQLDRSLVRNGNKTRRGPPRGAEYGLPVWLFFKLSQIYFRLQRLLSARAWASFEACRYAPYENAGRYRAQIIDNLVGCSKKYFVRTLSTSGANSTQKHQTRV